MEEDWFREKSVESWFFGCARFRPETKVELLRVLSIEGSRGMVDLVGLFFLSSACLARKRGEIPSLSKLNLFSNLGEIRATAQIEASTKSIFFESSFNLLSKSLSFRYSSTFHHLGLPLSSRSVTTLVFARFSLFLGSATTISFDKMV